MESSRCIVVDLFHVQHKTAMNREFIESTVRHVREYEGDVHRERRLKARECPWCFYFRRGMLAGQAFTSWACSFCLKEDVHANTAHPYLCTDCSDKLGLCVTCGADLDLKQRRTLERK
jgi:hypothetical protein